MKKLIYIVIVIIVAIVGAVGFKYYSDKSFNDFVRQHELDSQSLYAVSIELSDLGNDGTKIGNILSFGDNFNKNKYRLATFDGEKNWTTSLDKFENDYLVLVKKMSEDINSFKSKPLWLSGDKNKFLNELDVLMNEFEKEEEKLADGLKKYDSVMKTYFQILRDLTDYYDYVLNYTTDQEIVDNITKISELEKYSRKNYKFPGESSIETEFPESYAFIDNYKSFLATVYNAYIAYVAGDTVKFAAASAELDTSSAKIQALSDPFKETDDKYTKPYNKSVSGLLNKLVKLVDGFNGKELYKGLFVDKKVRLGKTRHTATILSLNLSDYSLGNEDKYPKATNVEELLKILKDKKYAGNLTFKLVGITYESKGDDSYKMTYKDEITGKTEDVSEVGSE